MYMVFARCSPTGILLTVYFSKVSKNIFSTVCREFLGIAISREWYALDCILILTSFWYTTSRRIDPAEVTVAIQTRRDLGTSALLDSSAERGLLLGNYRNHSATPTTNFAIASCCCSWRKSGNPMNTSNNQQWFQCLHLSTCPIEQATTTKIHLPSYKGDNCNISSNTNSPISSTINFRSGLFMQYSFASQHIKRQHIDCHFALHHHSYIALQQTWSHWRSNKNEVGSQERRRSIPDNTTNMKELCIF